MDSSLNFDSDVSVVTGSDRLSFMESDSFYARAPPLAASTVGRTAARTRMTKQPENEMGSFLDETPARPPASGKDDNAQIRLSYSAFDTGARPKTTLNPYSSKSELCMDPDGGDLPVGMPNGTDWSVVNDWCRENKDKLNLSDQDGTSSLGIVNVDDIDLSSNNLLDSPRVNLLVRNPERELTGQSAQDTPPPSLSGVKDQVSSDSNPWRHDGSSTLKEQGSDSNPFMSSNNSQDSKPDQMFARSHISTVKKASAAPVKNDPIVTAIRQSLFAKTAAIGEENEDGDASVHQIEIGEDDLNELDADFGEMNSSLDSDGERSPKKTPTNSRGPSGTGEEFQLDSVYLRPGTTGGEQTTNKLPYLSKVSLFDGGSCSSEIDTEDELEIARKSQGERREAAGEDSDTQTRPGLEGVSLTEESSAQLPITQRQSAEGNVVASPVPGDGGGGGDGSSGSDSEGVRGSGLMDYADGASSGNRGNMTSHTSATSRSFDKEEQRIGPMGDDLLSDLRFGRYATSSAGPADEDVRLSSRYLTAVSPAEDRNSPSFNIDEFLASQNGPVDQDFDPGNRLEASGFNADDASAVNQGQAFGMNPFEVKSSSFGSFGLSRGDRDMEESVFSGEIIQADWISSNSQDTDTPWAELECSTGTSRGSKASSLGQRSAAPGSPRRSGDRSASDTGRLSNTSTGLSRDVGPQQGLQQTPRDLTLSDSLSFTQTLVPTGYQKSSTEDHKQGNNQDLKKPKEVRRDGTAMGLTASSFSGMLQPGREFKSDLSDSHIFRKPMLPAPRAANFSKSVAKSRSSLSSDEGSTRSKQSSSAKSSQSEYFDLEFRTSLTNQATEQREGLKRVPSCGGTSQMDLTVNEDEFFGNADGLAMLDRDEQEFEAEHVFIKDDAMVDSGKSPDDSWAYRSIMTIARPSWLEGPEDEEEVCVRISVGTFMRGRTEALGSLSGEAEERPNFGMDFASPPKQRHSPARLIEEDAEYERTSGVGEYGADEATPVRSTPSRKYSEKEWDSTLTMESLLKTPKPDVALTVSTLDLGEQSIKPINVTDSTKLSMGEISMLLKAGESKPKLFENMLSSKSKFNTAGNAASTSRLPQTSGRANITSSSIRQVPSLSISSSGVTGSLGSINSSSAKTSAYSEKPSLTGLSYSSVGVADSPPKQSHLPVRKGSSLSRSFPKVSDSNSSVLHVLRNDSAQTSENKETEVSVKGVDESARKPQNESLRASAQSVGEEENWSSPNSSSYCPKESGLLDKLNNFNFSQNQSSRVPTNLAQELREKYKVSGPSELGTTDSLQYDKFVDNIYESTNNNNKTDRNNLSGNQTHSKYDDCKEEQRRKPTDERKNEQSVTTEGDQAKIRNSPVHDKRLLESDMERSRLDTGAVDHGYMPGHHIPDGTEYSQRSDYAHIGHKGELREDVAGLDDVGLVESRGFDILKGEKKGERSRQVNSDLRMGYGAHLPDDINDLGRKSKLDGDENGLKLNSSRLKTSLNPQPVLSTSPLIRQTAAQTVSQAEGIKGADSVEMGETQSSAEKKESWTQTSVVLKETDARVTVNGEVNPCDNQIRERSNPGDETGLKLSGIPPKLPVTSFKHNLLPDRQSTVPDRPHLLTNKSLMHTDFAQGNLQRDYSMEVMDRIYSRNLTLTRDDPASFQTLNATTATTSSTYYPPGRESLESNIAWQTLQGRESLDTLGGDVPRLSDVYNGHTSYDLFKQFTSLQSTPYPNGDFSKTSWTHGKTPVSSGPYSLTEGNLGKYRDNAPVPGKLCPVEAPGVLKFQEIHCVGISRKQVLPLKNPTDTWMECIIQVKSVERDGKAFSLDLCPFTLRKSKVIIDPQRTENIDVIFLPRWSGAYVAHLQLYSHSFVKKDDSVRDSICVNVTLQAIAEDPHIEVWEKSNELGEQKGVVNFGQMVWGTCQERTVCIRNVGLATLPLRLAITANKGWHCFVFEPEGRESDVSIISGRQQPSNNQGRSIINLSLTGSNQPFNYHEVKVWCRPPDKHYTKAMYRQPPEIFRCGLEVEVDVPSCKFPKLASLQLSATVGVKKLHIQAGLRQLEVRAPLSKSQSTRFRAINAGNLTIDVVFLFAKHKDVFTVSPESATLQPGVDVELTLTFRPVDPSLSKYSTLLLMCIVPEQTTFELVVYGEVTKSQPKKLQCDKQDVDFGGVPIGKTCVEKFRMINKDPETCSFTATARMDGILLSKTPDSRSGSTKTLDFTLPPEQIIPLYVLYCPTTTSSLRGKISLRPANDPTKYTVHVSGYGGVSKLYCSEEGTTFSSVQGFPCVGLGSFSLGKVKEIKIHNQGLRTAQVKVAAFKDLECRERLMSGLVIVQPSEFVLDVHQEQTLELILSMTEREFQAQTDRCGVGAALCLQYQDVTKAAKPYRSQLIIGLVKGTPAPAVTADMPVTPVKSSQPALLSPRHTLTETAYDSYNLLTSRSESSSGNVDSARVDNSGGWNIRPQHLVMYCSKHGSSEELDKFSIHNNNNRDIWFEIVWPGKMLSVIPADGVVKARENVHIRIFPASTVAHSLDKLPWSGTVMVTVDGIMKSLKVEVRPDHSKLEPDLDDRSLVPISSNIPHSKPGVNKLGNLLISRTVIQFPQTVVGKTSEETLDLTNLGDDTLRWMFSSFASPYLKKSTESNKEVFRVSYKVFDFSHQFGKLDGKLSAQLVLQFMPRSSGTFSQYWDLQTSGGLKTDPATRHDYIRLHLTGEGVDVSERKSKSIIADVENLLPRLPENVKLRLDTEKLEFSPVKPSVSVTMKVEIKNSHLEEAQVEVTAPKPPFYVKHTRFKVTKKRYIRLPVEFHPTRVGHYEDVLKFQASTGESLVLKLSGECR